MKKFITFSLLVVFLCGFSRSSYAEDELPAYFKVATLEMQISDAAEIVNKALTGGGFEILGDYHPESNPELYVIAYTRNDLQKICLKKDDRGILASILKIGFIEKDGKVEVSMITPL